MKYQLVVITILLSLSISVYAETWNITEGPNSEWTGEWTIDGSKKAFSCSERSGATVLQAKCLVIRSGVFFAIEKRQVSDNNSCNYFGRKTENQISGEYFCSNGGPYNWSATVAK